VREKPQEIKDNERSEKGRDLEAEKNGTQVGEGELG